MSWRCQGNWAADKCGPDTRKSCQCSLCDLGKDSLALTARPNMIFRVRSQILGHKRSYSLEKWETNVEKNNKMAWHEFHDCKFLGMVSETTYWFPHLSWGRGEGKMLLAESSLLLNFHEKRMNSGWFMVPLSLNFNISRDLWTTENQFYGEFFAK